MTEEVEMVTITKEEYESLLRIQKYAECLDSGGVDNWEWYGDSLREGGYWDDEDEE